MHVCIPLTFPVAHKVALAHVRKLISAALVMDSGERLLVGHAGAAVEVNPIAWRERKNSRHGKPKMSQSEGHVIAVANHVLETVQMGEVVDTEHTLSDHISEVLFFWSVKTKSLDLHVPNVEHITVVEFLVEIGGEATLGAVFAGEDSLQACYIATAACSWLILNGSQQSITAARC